MTPALMIWVRCHTVLAWKLSERTRWGSTSSPGISCCPSICT